MLCSEMSLLRFKRKEFMPNILCIDTSTDICSVILGNEEGVLYERVSYEGRDHSSKAGVFVDEILKKAEDKGQKLDAVAVCSGPGSYTGLRIGVSLAKGLCFGYDIPLIAIDSLEIMAREVFAAKQLEEAAILCPMIDARRMEVYVSLWSEKMDLLKSPEAKIIEEGAYADYQDKTFYYFGTGAEKCQELLSSDNFKYIPDIKPMAQALLLPALDAFQKETFEDLAYFEPFYLKQFQTTVSKKNVLGL